MEEHVKREIGTPKRVLALLENCVGEYYSGEAIAGLLGVSRAAVWKAIQEIRTRGIDIQSQPGLGYCLAAETDWLDEERVRRFAGSEYPVRVYGEIDSTNRAAKKWAVEGAPHGAWVLANRQTAGQGRRGRNFISPEGGIYLSVVLRPDEARQDVGVLTAAAAVEVCRAVSSLCGVELTIKWVNDLFYRDKKCCGILTEAALRMEDASIDYLVLGVGINFTTPEEHLGDFQNIAGSLFPYGGAPVARAKLAANIHNRLVEKFKILNQRDFMNEYRARSMVLGNMVTVQDRCPYIAKAVAIDEEARLIVEKSDGQKIALSSGEISIAPREGNV